MTSLHHLALGLSDAFLAGEWTLAGLVARGSTALGARPRWLPTLAKLALGTFPEPPTHASESLAWVLAESRSLRRAVASSRGAPTLRGYHLPEPSMAPSRPPIASWGLPSLPTEGDLAAWLGIVPRALDWYSDTRSLARATPVQSLLHYVTCWVRRRSGGLRLLEAPRWRLKALQRRVHRGLLSKVPSHGAAHGFCAGRSALTCVRPHVGRRVVLRLDLKDFFASVSAAKVRSVFVTLGYPEPVARKLTGLCVTVVPRACWEDRPRPRDPAEALAEGRAWRRFRAPHLPQGAPTSPSLANLCAWRLDLRLDAAAKAAGCAYTRYADDLLFSGDEAFARRARRFGVLVAAIALDEGFQVNHRKTRVMRRGVRQRALGLVVNVRPGVGRRERDALKATLHNCVKHGPDSQRRAYRGDFRAHLLGQVAHVESVNPSQGARLRAIFERIAWGEGEG